MGARGRPKLTKTIFASCVFVRKVSRVVVRPLLVPFWIIFGIIFMSFWTQCLKNKQCVPVWELNVSHLIFGGGGRPQKQQIYFHATALFENSLQMFAETCATWHGPPTRDNTTRHGPARLNTSRANANTGCDDPTRNGSNTERTAMIQHAQQATRHGPS